MGRVLLDGPLHDLLGAGSLEDGRHPVEVGAVNAVDGRQDRTRRIRWMNCGTCNDRGASGMYLLIMQPVRLRAGRRAVPEL